MTIVTDEQSHTLTAIPNTEHQATPVINDENPFIITENAETTTPTAGAHINNFPELDNTMPNDMPPAGANDNDIDNILLELDNEIAENTANLNLEDINIPADQNQDEIQNTTHTAGHASINFTPTPTEGFPEVQDGTPRRVLVNISGRQSREWLETEGYNAFIQVAGMNACNYDTPNTVARLKVALTGAVGIRDPLIATPTALTDPNSYKPQSFFLRNIPEFLHRRLLHQRVWSTPDIAFIAYPTTFKFPRYIGTYRGFTTGDQYEIKKVFIKHLRSDRVAAMIDQLRSSHRTLSEVPLRVARDAIVRSMEIKVFHITEVEPYSNNHVSTPVVNLYISSPTTDTVTWMEWQSFLRNIVFTSSFNGNTTVMDMWKCGKCHSDDHPSGVCPFPNVEGWLTNLGGPTNNNANNQTPRGGYNGNRGGGGRGFRGRGMPRSGTRYRGHGY